MRHTTSSLPQHAGENAQRNKASMDESPRTEGGHSYIPLSVIGRGSFGIVYHAKNEKTGEDVAIKRVLYDRRLHNRELVIMRDILSEARHGSTSVCQSPEEKAAQFAEKAAQSPLSPTLMRSPVLSERSKSGSLTSFTSNTKMFRSSHILLRNHPHVVRLRDYYISDDGENGEYYLNLVMSYLPTDLKLLVRAHFRSASERYEHRHHSDDGHYEDFGNSVPPAMPVIEDPKTSMFPILYTKVLLFQLCRALAFLHTRHVCHRDVKPSNILVDPETGRLQLCDFGSAKQIRDRKREKNVSYICSRYYRAPELLFGALHYGSEVDMWSVGCIAAELLRSSAATLFKGSTTVDQMAEIFKVLGAPSAVEMIAMNPQGARAMQLTQEQFQPSARGAPNSNAFGSQHEEGMRRYTAPSNNATSSPAGVPVSNMFADRVPADQKGAEGSGCPALRLDNDYFDSYNILKVDAIRWEDVLHAAVPQQAVDFVSRLLCYIPEKRMTAAAAVEHPFFAELFSRQSSPNANHDGKGQDGDRSSSAASTVFPRLPNGRLLPVEMFMLTEAEASLYSEEFQQRMHREVQRLSSAAAAATF